MRQNIEHIFWDKTLNIFFTKQNEIVNDYNIEKHGPTQLLMKQTISKSVF